MCIPVRADAFDVGVRLDVKADPRAVLEALAVVFHCVVVVVDPCGDRLRDADADKRTILVGMPDVRDLMRLEAGPLGFDREGVMAELVGDLRKCRPSSMLLPEHHGEDAGRDRRIARVPNRPQAIGRSSRFSKRTSRR